MMAVGIVLGVIAWMTLCWLTLAFLTVPLTLLALSAGLAYGTALSVVGYLRIYRGTEDKQVLARPDAQARRRPRAPYPRWDDAWPCYLSWQVERDIRAAVAWPGRLANQLWAWGQGQASRYAKRYGWPLAALLPVMPVPLGFLAGVTAGTYGGWAVLAAAVEAAMAVPRLARLSAIGVLRAVDSSV